MLVLSRKPGEKIHIGCGITITLICVQGQRVRIGIDAPEDVPVVRAEIDDFLSPHDHRGRSGGRYPHPPDHGGSTARGIISLW